jgi:hypothetical protein
MNLYIGALRASQWKIAQQWMIDNGILSLEQFEPWDWRLNIEMTEEDAVAFKLKFGI